MLSAVSLPVRVCHTHCRYCIKTAKLIGLRHVAHAGCRYESFLSPKIAAKFEGDYPNMGAKSTWHGLKSATFGK